MKDVAWDLGTRYIIAISEDHSPAGKAVIVDVSDGSVMPEPVAIGSILAQGEPDDWWERRGPDYFRAASLAAISVARSPR